MIQHERIAWLVPLCALQLTIGTSGSLEGQSILTDCSDRCGLRLAHVATLGQPAGPGYVGHPVGLVQRADGLFALLDRADQDRVKFFGPDGRYLRSFGRRGEGPGEFQTTNFITLLQGDSIEVYDLGNRRFTVIGPDFALGRTSRGVDLMAPSMVRFPDGSRVMNGTLYTPGGIGFPLHAFDPDGSVVLSFGADPPIEDLRRSGNVRRKLATNNTETVWAVAEPRYRLEEWARTGAKVRSFDRHVAWFQPHDGSTRGPDGTPQPYVRAIHQDTEGLLWTVVWVPGVRWEDGLERGRGIHGLPADVVSDHSRLYDSVVEVIDPESGHVVGSQRFELPLWGFVTDGLVFAMEEGESGEVRISVWEISFVESAGW